MKNIYKNVCKTLSLALMISTVDVAFYNDARASEESRSGVSVHSGAGLAKKIGLGVTYQESQPAISVLKNIRKLLKRGEKIDARTVLDYICFGQIKENAQSYIPQVSKSKEHQKPKGDFVSETRADSDVKELVFDIIWRITKGTPASDLQEMIEENLQGELPEYVKRHMSNGLSHIVRAAGDLRADRNANIDWFIKLAKFDPTTHIEEKSANFSSIKSLFEEKSESGKVSTPKKPSETPKKKGVGVSVLSKVQAFESSERGDSSKMESGTPKKTPLPKSPRKDASSGVSLEVPHDFLPKSPHKNASSGVSSVSLHDSLPKSPRKEVSSVPSVIEEHLPDSNVPTSSKETLLKDYEKRKKTAEAELKERHREEELISKEDRTVRDFNALKEAITRYKSYTLKPYQHSDTLTSFNTEVKSFAELLSRDDHVRINPSQKKELLEMVKGTPALSEYIDAISVEDAKAHTPDGSSDVNDIQDENPFSAFMLPVFDAPIHKNEGLSPKGDSDDQRKSETPSDEFVAPEVRSDNNAAHDSESETIVITPSSEQETHDDASKKKSNPSETDTDQEASETEKKKHLLPRYDRPKGAPNRKGPSQEHLKKLKSRVTRQGGSTLTEEPKKQPSLDSSDDATNGTSFDALLNSFGFDGESEDPSKKEDSPLENVVNDGGGTSDILTIATDDVQGDDLDPTHKPSVSPDLSPTVVLGDGDDEKKGAREKSGSEDTDDEKVSHIPSSTPPEVSSDSLLGGADSKKEYSNTPISLMHATLVPDGQDPLSQKKPSSGDSNDSLEENDTNDSSGRDDGGIPLQPITHREDSSNSERTPSVEMMPVTNSSTPVVQQPTVSTTSHQPPMPGARTTVTQGQRLRTAGGAQTNSNKTNAKKKKGDDDRCCVQ